MRSTTRGRRRGCLRGIALVGVWLAMVCQGAENPATEPLPIRNPGFEEVGQDGSLNGWGRWWQRNGKGSATIVEDAHSGRRAIRIQNDDVRDWARDLVAMSAIDKLCNMKFVKNKLGTLNTGAYLVVALLNELDAVKGELAKLEATAIINGGN